MKITSSPMTVQIPQKEGGKALSFQLKRDASGVIHIKGATVNDFSAGMGYAHTHDRMVQMQLVKLIGQGRLGESLAANDGTFAVDKFMREMGLAHQSEKEIEGLSAEVKEFLESYCEGANYCMKTESRPLEMILAGYKPRLEPWTIRDTLITVKVMSYVGLAQTQTDVEKLLIQMIHAGNDIEKIKSLFGEPIQDITQEQVELIKKVNIYDEMVPKDVKFMSAVPKLVASNNWAVAPAKSETGNAIACNDPHLEIDRLPQVWYELCGQFSNGRECLGATMPGVPGVVMGRTKDVHFGFTYGFMDMVDFFLEDVKDNQYRSNEIDPATGSPVYKPFAVRKEVVKRKRKDAVVLYIKENDNGVLEADPTKETIEDGIYLTRAWSGHNNGAANTVVALYELLHVKDAIIGKDAARKCTISCNWILADNAGNIVYQQSGLNPNRTTTGLYPVEGWKQKNKWQGMRPYEDLSVIINPECGFLVSANHNVNQDDKPKNVNMPMGSYRYDRISQLLRQKEKLSIDDMKKFQADLYSLQGEIVVPMLLKAIGQEEEANPAIETSPSKVVTEESILKELKEWDYRYNKESRGAVIFETFYFALLREIFGKEFIGLEAWDYVVKETGVIIDFYRIFDNIINSSEESGEIARVWFKNKSKNEYMQEAWKITVETIMKEKKMRILADQRTVTMTNILFEGKMPGFLGFDFAPYVVEGSRATVIQGAVFRSHGRATTFHPSWRYVSDMGTMEAHTMLPAGPSGRRFSPHFTRYVNDWVAHKYKVLNPSL